MEQLLLNPVFAAAYERVGKAIDTAQDKLNSALEKVAERIEHLEDVIADLVERTAKMSDGTAVFRNSDGKLVTADGRTLTDAEALLLINADDLQSYDQYTGAKDALNGARAKQDKLSGVQTKIDDARDRRDKAETPEELDDIEDDVDTFITEIENMERASPAFNLSAQPSEEMLLADIELDVGVQFDQSTGQTR